MDENALAVALRRGCPGGAGIDLLTVEPPSGGHPLLAPDIPNLIVTPHIAWANPEARQHPLDKVSENIRAIFSGVPRNRLV